MKAQASLFIIVGLVVLITVGILIYTVASTQQPSTQPRVDTQDNTIQQCLEAATDVALETLTTRGSVTGQHYYIQEETDTFLLGRPSYLGLCDEDGENPAGTSESCPPNTYAPPNQVSIQEQLIQNISTQVNSCADTNEEVEVLFQRDQTIFRVGDAQYISQAPLTSTWAAIRRFIDRETTNSTYYEGGTINVTGCDNCMELQVRQQEPVLPGATKYYVFSTPGGQVARIAAVDRGVAYVSEDEETITEEIQDYSCAEGLCANVISIDRDELSGDGYSVEEGDNKHFRISFTEVNGVNIQGGQQP